MGSGLFLRKRWSFLFLLGGQPQFWPWPHTSLQYHPIILYLLSSPLHCLSFISCHALGNVSVFWVGTGFFSIQKYLDYCRLSAGDSRDSLSLFFLFLLRARTTHIAGRGERPGLLSLPLLFPWSIAPFISSRMALARELRVGLPMEAVVYRGMLFSAIEAWKPKHEALNVKRKRVVDTFSVAHLAPSNQYISFKTKD